MEDEAPLRELPPEKLLEVRLILEGDPFWLWRPRPCLPLEVEGLISSSSISLIVLFFLVLGKEDDLERFNSRSNCKFRDDRALYFPLLVGFCEDMPAKNEG